MEKKPPEPMTPFDKLVTSPALQAVKLVLPYVPGSGRRILAVFIKIQELRRTFRLSGEMHQSVSAQAFTGENASIFNILESLKPYLSPEDADMLDMAVSLKEMMDAAEIMKESAASGKESSISPADLISSMLPPEQQEAFQMYSAMFSQPPDDILKGDDNSERMDEQSKDTGNGSCETGTD